MKKALIVLGALALLLVLAAVVAVLVIDPERLINERKDALAAEVSETLGRELTLGAIDGSVLPTLAAEVRDLRLSGPEGEAEPQLSVGKVVVRIDLLRALLSLGAELEVEAIEVDEVTVRVRRDAEGRWDFQDILDRLAEAEAKAPPPSAEEEPSDLSFLEGARLSRVALSGVGVQIDDAQLGRPLAIEQASLALSNIQLGAPIEAALRATLVDGESRSPVALDLRLSELRRDLSFDPLPELSVAVKAGPLALGPWGGLLPADSLAPSDGTLELDLQLEASAGLTRASVKGSLALAALRLRQGSVRGKPVELSIDLDAEADLEAPRYELRKLSLSGGGLAITGGLVAHGLSPAALERADLSLRVSDLSELLAVLPAGSDLLPPELKLAGPVQAAIEADGKKVGVRVSLDAATVGWSDLFLKKAGRPLHLKLAGTVQGSRLTIPDLQLAVDEARMKGSLSLGTAGDAPMTAQLSTGPVSLASLRELLPPVAAGLSSGRRVTGGFEMKVQAEAMGERQKAHLELLLKELDLDLPELAVKGSGRVIADAAPGADRTTLSLTAALGGLALRSRDETGAAVLDKPAGQPLDLELLVQQKEESADLERLSVTIGGSRVRGRGTVTGLASATPRYEVQLSELVLAFDDLRRSLPGAASLPPGGRLEGSGVYAGQPELPATVSLDFTLGKLVWGRSRMTGTFGLKNPDAPDFRCDLKSSFLDVDELLGEESTEASPAAPTAADANPHGLDAETRDLLSGISGQCSLAADRARFQGMEMTRFLGKLVMRKGVVTFEALDFQLWGGKVSAAGTTFDLPAESTGYRLALQVADLDLGQALAGRGRLAGSVRGVTDQDVKLTGRGLSAADLGRTATGLVGLETSSLELTSLDVLGAISAPLSAGLAKARLGGIKPLALGSADGKKGTVLREVKTVLDFDAGKFTLKKPLRAPTRFGAMELEGGGSLDNQVDLKGTALIAPEIINRAVGRQVLTEPARVPLKIGGSWDAPRVTGVEVGPLVKQVALGAGAAALGKVAPGLDTQAQDAKAKLEAQKEAAEAQARQRAEAAKQQAQAARARAEAEARARADKLKAEAAAKKKAAEERLRKEAEKKKQEAKEKAKKLLGF